MCILQKKSTCIDEESEGNKSSWCRNYKLYLNAQNSGTQEKWKYEQVI